MARSDDGSIGPVVPVFLYEYRVIEVPLPYECSGVASFIRFWRLHAPLYLRLGKDHLALALLVVGPLWIDVGCRGSCTGVKVHTTQPKWSTPRSQNRGSDPRSAPNPGIEGNESTRRVTGKFWKCIDPFRMTASCTVRSDWELMR